jgi:uncharacterized protein (TIGR02611 family)
VVARLDYPDAVSREGPSPPAHGRHAADGPPEGYAEHPKHGARAERADMVRFPRYQAWRDRVRSRRSLDLTWRIVVTTVGVAVLLAGVAMLALPGPGWAAIFVGLAVLGSEYDWASRLLHRTRERVTAAAAKVRDPRVRRRNQLITAVAAVAVVAAAWWYLAAFGPPGVVVDVLGWFGIDV